MSADRLDWIWYIIYEYGTEVFVIKNVSYGNWVKYLNLSFIDKQKLCKLYQKYYLKNIKNILKSL